MPTPRIVLASASPRRAELLARLGVEVLVRPADVDETPHPGETATTLVVRLARDKATAGASTDTTDGGTTDGEVVLAADTVVVLDGELLGKPVDATDAQRMLRRLSGQTHEVVTGIAVTRGQRAATTHVTTRVTFRALTEAEVDWYVATGEPFDKAGAYGLQGAGAVLVARVDGSDTNVIGLPLAETVALLREVGVEVLTTARSPEVPDQSPDR